MNHPKVLIEPEELESDRWVWKIVKHIAVVAPYFKNVIEVHPEMFHTLYTNAANKKAQWIKLPHNNRAIALEQKGFCACHGCQRDSGLWDTPTGAEQNVLGKFHCFYMADIVSNPSLEISELSLKCEAP